MGLFDAGKATSVTTPGALSPADVAGKLFAIKLLLSRLQQGGGAPQTLGEYIKSGPRKAPAGLVSQGGDALMAALSQPGAFNRGPTVQKYQPSSPSTFQDLAGLLGVGLAGYGAYKGEPAPQESAMDSLLKLYLMKQMGMNVTGGGGIGGGAAGGLGGTYGIAANATPAMNFSLDSYNDPGYGVMDTSGTDSNLSASDYLFGQSLGAY